MTEKRALRANLSPDAYEAWQWLAQSQGTNTTALLEGMGIMFMRWRSRGGLPDAVAGLADFQSATELAREIAVRRLSRDPDRPSTPPRGHRMQAQE